MVRVRNRVTVRISVGVGVNLRHFFHFGHDLQNSICVTTSNQEVVGGCGLGTGVRVGVEGC
jgi:hypothetical protein